jgi:hypothetical protein
MDDLALILFIDWSNGHIKDKESICHYKESVSIDQIINIIGVTFYTYLYFYQYYDKKVKSLLNNNFPF